MKKVINKILEFIMRKKGYSSYLGIKLIKGILSDLFKNKQNTLKEKIWAYKRGFLSPNIKGYGLTPNNYKLFLSDFDYCKLYPINGTFKMWIDDKITTKYILYPFKDYLPKYYCHIKDNCSITSLIDGKSIKNIENIIDLLKEEKDLALKLTNGTCGAGFYKLSYINNDFFINNSNVNQNELIEFLSRLENYLVTEYITVHSDIRKVYSHSANTLRVMVIKEDGKQPIIANAMMRFGTKESGVVDFSSCGGIFSIVDINDGRYYNAKTMESNNVVSCRIHPDTKVNIEGILPHFELIKEKVIEISKYLSEVRYMGFDVAITDNGFKIIEVNSHQDIQWFQWYYPLLIDNPAELFFKKLQSER